MRVSNRISRVWMVEMASFEIVLRLSDTLRRRAEAEGLLDPDAITELIRTEIERRQHVSNLFEAADRLASLDIRPMSDAEVEAEVQAVRHARRS
jgi:hypothetical protein